MKKSLLVFLILAAVAMNFTYGEETKQKSILMIIASKNFRDEELFKPKKLFEENGYKVTIASTTTKKVTGMLKGKAKPDILLKNAKVKDYDAVVFVGGSGARMYYDNQNALNIAQEAVKDGKVLGAICLAPNILAKAGLLKGKKATCWNSEILEEEGAKYQQKSVVKDGKIITANGPKAARKFGNTILKALEE